MQTASQFGYGMSAKPNTESTIADENNTYDESVRSFSHTYVANQAAIYNLTETNAFLSTNVANPMQQLQVQLNGIQQQMRQLAINAKAPPPPPIQYNPSMQPLPLNMPLLQTAYQANNNNDNNRHGGRNNNKDPPSNDGSGYYSAKQRNLNPVKHFNNWNYCRSHGYGVEDWHKSETCPNPDHNHIWNASQNNLMGVHDKTKHKNIFPGTIGKPYPGMNPNLKNSGNYNNYNGNDNSYYYNGGNCNNDQRRNNNNSNYPAYNTNGWNNGWNNNGGNDNGYGSYGM